MPLVGTRSDASGRSEELLLLHSREKREEICPNAPSYLSKRDLDLHSAAPTSED